MRRSVLLAAFGWAFPTRGKPAIARELLDYAASELAEQIDNARQQAIADGVRPVPPGVYRCLLGYFPAALLQRCRFATDCCRPLVLPALAFSYGDAKAITLGDVVLFKNDRIALNDMRVWAHALSHVMQFQRWGIDGFAERYVRDEAAVEHEAIENAERYAAWRAGYGIGAAGDGRPAGAPLVGATPPRSDGSANRSSIATFR